VGVVTDGIDPRRFGRARRPCLSDNMLFVLALMAPGCGPPDGPYEGYHDNGQLERKGHPQQGPEMWRVD
jgi:hypothetical protein